jgi:nucleoside phosphorylase
MKTIGLIASGKIEASAFLKNISVKKKLKLGQFNVYYFKLNGYEFFLVICEKSMISARLATALLVEKISPLCIISFGIAGGIEEDVRIGDIICGISASMIEKGVFEQYIALSTMPLNIRKFLFNLLIETNKRLFFGTIITVNGEQAIQDHRKIKFNHPVLDMETLGVAQAASQRKIPVLSLRGITHNLAIQANTNLHTVFDYTWHYNKNLAKHRLLTHPWLLFGLIDFYRTKIRVSNQVSNTLYPLLKVLSLNQQNNTEIQDYQI